MRIALVVGHNERDKGAYSPHLKMSEWDYWKLVAEELNKNFPDKYDVFYRNPNLSYGRQMKEIVQAIKDYDLAVELHWNSFNNEQANGCTVLYYKTNKCAEKLANRFQLNMERYYGIRKRDLMPLTDKDSNVNGSFGILNAKPTYILTELFFGSNKKECDKMAGYMQLANLINRTIGECL